MRYVIDASSAFKWVVPEPDSDKAIRLREDYRNGLIELLAPDIFPAEIANSLLMAERRGRISDFQPFLADALSTCPVLHETRPLLPGAVAIIRSVTTGARISLYDGLYVALAEREGCELITDDSRLINALGKSHPFITPLSSLP